ncbi:MAG: vWA domain-containing protein [Pirellulales bacterium]
MTHDSPLARCLIFLVDCSESMRHRVDATQNTSWLEAISKAIADDVVPELVNLDPSQLDFAVIPYRTDRWGKPVVGPSAFSFPPLVPAFPARLLVQWQPSAANEFRLPCGGGSPAIAALEHCANLLDKWTQDHPTSAPPVVVHITDGVPTDGDPATAARRIQSLRTQRGPVLLLHVVCDCNVDPNCCFVAQPPAVSSPVLETVSLWHAASSPMGRYQEDSWNPLELLHQSGYFPQLSPESPGLICASTWDKLTEYLKVFATLLLANE